MGDTLELRLRRAFDLGDTLAISALAARMSRTRRTIFTRGPEGPRATEVRDMRHGLAITASWILHNRWNVTHILSGLYLADRFTLNQARSFLDRVAPLTDWTLGEHLLLVDSEALGQRVVEARDWVKENIK